MGVTAISFENGKIFPTLVFGAHGERVALGIGYWRLGSEN